VDRHGEDREQSRLGMGGGLEHNFETRWGEGRSSMADSVTGCDAVRALYKVVLPLLVVQFERSRRARP